MGAVDVSIYLYTPCLGTCNRPQVRFFVRGHDLSQLNDILALVGSQVNNLRDAIASFVRDEGSGPEMAWYRWGLHVTRLHA